VVDGTRSQGIEFTVQGNIKNLSIIAGYANNEHKVVADNNVSKKGNRFLNAPGNIANIWLQYKVKNKVLKGLGFGIGGRYTSNQVGNISTQKYLVPQSTVLYAAINYDVKRFTFQVNIYNLTNERYFNGGLSRIPYSSLGKRVNVCLGINYLIN